MWQLITNNMITSTVFLCPRNQSIDNGVYMFTIITVSDLEMFDENTAKICHVIDLDVIDISKTLHFVCFGTS